MHHLEQELLDCRRTSGSHYLAAARTGDAASRAARDPCRTAVWRAVRALGLTVKQHGPHKAEHDRPDGAAARVAVARRAAPHRRCLHESSLARTRPTDRILTCRCDTTLVGRGRSSDSRSHSRGRPHSPAQLNSEREGHRR